MARPAPELLDEDTIAVPRRVCLPVELRPPEGFDPDEPATWPRDEGRLEWVGGRLLWMPPCGDEQQDTVADVVGTLIAWVRAHPEFVVGTNHGARDTLPPAALLPGLSPRVEEFFRQVAVPALRRPRRTRRASRRRR